MDKLTQEDLRLAYELLGAGTAPTPSPSCPVWILGASDPEMERIEALLRGCGEAVVHATATGPDGFPRRVFPAEAYAATGACAPGGADALATIRAAARVVFVECEPAAGSPLAAALAAQVPACGPGWAEDHDPACGRDGGRCLGAAAEVVGCDHHRPVDPGFGRPPGEFLAASSRPTPAETAVQTDRYAPEVREILDLLGVDGIFISDESSFDDFGLGEEALSQLESWLGFIHHNTLYPEMHLWAAGKLLRIVRAREAAHEANLHLRRAEASASREGCPPEELHQSPLVEDAWEESQAAASRLLSLLLG